MTITISEILQRLDTLSHELMIKSMDSHDDYAVDAYNDASEMMDAVIDRIKERL